MSAEPQDIAPDTLGTHPAAPCQNCHTTNDTNAKPMNVGVKNDDISFELENPFDNKVLVIDEVGKLI